MKSPHLQLTVLAVLFGLSATRPAAAAPQPMTRDAIVALAKTVVGFSYWWGGGKWLPGAADKGKCIPKGSNGCPDCSHTGAYGADCSGFVAKAWQIDKPTPLEQGYHPYSTWHFDNYSYWWDKIPKGQAQRADAYNYNKNGAGHIFLYDKGDPWGSVYAWECKGCSYGCVYNLRSVSSDYAVLRRKLISEAPKCTPHCEGAVMVGADCGKGDCAAYGATCANDDLGLRCVSAFCPAKGKTTTCLPDPKNAKVATCTNGALSDVGDCSVYGAICSTKATGAGKCVAALCLASPTAAPKAGALCYQGKRYTCSITGDLAETPCPPDQPCQTAAGASGPGSGSCGPKPCANCDDGNPCTTDSCSNGNCVHQAAAGPCTDNNACTVGDACTAGGCSGQPKDCADGSPCTTDSCQGGSCQHAVQEGSCDDGNVCTKDSCGSKGCVHAHQPGACEDGDGCTAGGSCIAGNCTVGGQKMCDDDNSCTADSCKDGSCVYQPLAGGCDDGDACSLGDYCALGQCLAGAPKACDDGKACTLDTCKDGMCQHLSVDCADTSAKGDAAASPDSAAATGDGAAGLAEDASAGGSGLGSLDGAGRSGAAVKNVAPAPSSGCSAASPGSAGSWLALLWAAAAVAWRRRKPAAD